MVIYQIGGSLSDHSGTNWYWHYTVTKQEAKAHVAELKRDGLDVSMLDISPMEYDGTRKGIVEALNDFISQACLNEG